MIRICLLFVLAPVLSAEPARSDVMPLAHAHAHNDYHHDRPLLDALAHGFTSVEADVFLVENELRVAHDPEEITPDRTLRSLYLDPLRRLVRRNDGSVYPRRSRFILLVDVKSAAGPTYRKLHETLADYAKMLTMFDSQGRRDGAVLVIVSGNRDLDLMCGQSVRYAGYDGRLADLDTDAPADLIPLISDHWGRHFRWRGEGAMPEAEQEKLAEVVSRAHAKGRLVRFWATPDRPSPARKALWRELLAAGVALINTDDLAGLQEFLRER